MNGAFPNRAAGRRDFRRGVAAGWLAVLLLAAGAACPPASAGEAKASRRNTEWLRLPVFFALDQEPLGRFLLDFSSRQGVSCLVSPRISGTISGRFNMPDSARLLSMITKASGVQWYYDGGRVFYYASDEVQNASIPLRTLDVDQIRELLDSVGAFDPRYELRSVKQGDDTILYVNAPPRYVEIMREMVDKFDIKPKANRVMRLFRLQHAWARDQKVNMSDGQQTIPGVATTLRNIVISELKNAGMDQQAASREAESTIMPDMRLNAVIVWEDQERMGYFESLIRDLDQDTELVEIRCAILDVGVDKTRELGLGWGYERTDGKAQGGINLSAGRSGDAVAEGLPSFANSLGSGLNATTILGGGLNRFMVRVHALESEGDARVLSRPTVLTTDNVQAVIERSETFYVRLEAYEDVALEEITYGTKLTVVPHIISHPDGRRRIQMMIEVEDGAETDTGEVDNIPRTVNSKVTTQAVVAEGQALVIGGHYSEVYKQSKSGVPVLSKVPGFGVLFRTKRKDVNRYERLFVIAPRIITLNDLPAAHDDEMEGTFTNHEASPIFTMPSASDSPEAIGERAAREAAELEQQRIELEKEGETPVASPAGPGIPAAPDMSEEPLPVPEIVPRPNDGGPGLFTLPRVEEREVFEPALPNLPPAGGWTDTPSDIRPLAGPRDGSVVVNGVVVPGAFAGDLVTIP